MAFLTYGSIYFSTPALTTLAAGVPSKALGTTTAMALGDFLSTGDNRLVNDSGVTRAYDVLFVGSMSATAGCLAEAHLYKIGTLIPGATIARTIANGGDQGAFSVSAQVSLDDGQYVELWVESDGVQDITIESGVLSAKVIG